MNQNSRTMLFVGVAALAAIGAWATRPSSARITPDDEVINKPLAPDFVDPLAARSMEIVDFDEATGEPKVFKVAQVNGIWSLPSKYEYPADAERQLGEAAANLMDLKMLGVASNLASDHPLFGVVDPSTAKVGATGVGKKITLEGEGGKPLLSLIVGKEVKDQPDQRYVRVPGRDAVYPVKINTGKLSTKFEDWIEKDLLKLSGWDITEVVENNYSIDKLQGKVIPGEVVDLKYDDAQSKWSMEGLAAGEELDTTKLNELKSALDDLKIVDVRRKPAGLSAELRREEGIQLDQAALVSLANKGFYLTQDGSLLSNEGETIVHTKDGVEYVLRFGDIATDTEEGSTEKKDEKAGEAKAEDGKDPSDKEAPKTGANRYIFVTARFDESLIPKPGEAAPAAGEATPAAEGAPAEAAATEPAAAETAVPAEEKPTEEKPAEEKPAEEAPATETPAAPAEPAAETPAETPPPAADANGPQGAGGDDGGQDPATETPPATTAAAAAPPAAAAPAGPPAAAEDPAKKAAEAEQLRKQSEYEAKIKKGQERVKELNDRFADWYYVISDDVYKKIRLTRSDVIKKPEAKEGAENADIPKSPLDELQQLKEEGLPAAPTP